MTSYEDFHDEVLNEEFPLILKCLGEKGERIFEIEKTSNGYRIVECCDGYYGTTLSQEQILQLIYELKTLSET